MSTIKDKPLKKKHTDPRITIDVIHNDIISNFDNEDEENDYYLDNGLILSEYYNNGFTASTKKTNNKNNILDFFKSEDIDKDKDKDNEANKKTENIISTYLSKVDDEYINSNFEDTEDMMHICIQCKNSMIYKLQESEILCEYCGYTDKILMNNEKISYKETPREISYFAYKRINHFNEWLAQFQAKETTDIPMNVYTDVLKELQKNKHIDISNITNKQIREILKKLKHNKFYEHIPNIINIITGNKAPSLLPQHEELLRNMFKEIQTPFMKHCPEERKNFLSYSYVLHKFCELLELDELLKYFPLLKSREKLQQQDRIWKKICQELQWQYIASI
jgi:DNA-directed RNA polymerase subunit RPC12/RpoP